MGAHNSKHKIKYDATQNSLAIKTFNENFAKPPNSKKSYETSVYNYFMSTYRIVTQKELYDFYLPDYNLYVEIDEQHHFASDKSKQRQKHAAQDNKKIIACLNKPATLLRLSWFSVQSGNYKEIIEYAISDKCKNMLVLSSGEIYRGHMMLDGISEDKIIFYSQ